MNKDTKTQTDSYFAAYMRFIAEDEKEAAYLMGADNCVGDLLHFERSAALDGISTVVINRFGKKIGTLESSDSQTGRFYEEKGWTLIGVIDFIAVKAKKRAGHLVQIVAFSSPPKHAKDLNVFVKIFANALAEGKRLDPLLSAEEQKKMLSAGGVYLPERKRPLEKSKDFEYLKTELSLKEKIVEQARQKNPGCYAASILWLNLVCAGVIFLILSLFGIL
ncbi:MAG: hypothetical protein HUJ51_04330 [Eggerthellaceae bacterium]|nr:hypothetical protein [Eggerthellaceae bacterium]